MLNGLIQIGFIEKSYDVQLEYIYLVTKRLHVVVSSLFLDIDNGI